MIARRSARERKAPKPVYEVEDTRRGVDESDEVDTENGDKDDEDSNEDDDSEVDEADAKVNKTSVTTKRATKRPDIKKNKLAQRKSLVKPRKLKPVPEERQRADDGEEEEGEEEENVFYEAIKRAKCSMSDLLIDWRDRFEQNPDISIREILNFILKCCGGSSQSVPSTEKLEQLDMSDVVDYVVQDLEKSNSQSYPIALRQKGFKSFQRNFVEFWETFINESFESEILFTTDIIGQFVDWLTALSSAEVRAIRHTTTVAAYALGSGLVKCASVITQQLSVVKRQLNAENRSSKSSKLVRSKKQEQLKENKEMHETRHAKILGLVNLVFNGIVVHRYRDVMPEIRLESARTLGSWISVLPNHFFKDNYLKYLGWMLNDKDATVRTGVVEMLQELYENDDVTSKLELFTSRFLPRFLELCNDVDDGVVQATIKLLIAVDKRSLISADVELHTVEKLVFDDQDAIIRKTAAEFVCLQYDAFGVAESKKLTKDQLNTQAIALVEFAEEYVTNHNVPPQAIETMVDAFWGLDDCQVLQDWKLLTNLLLEDKNAPNLSSDHQTYLIRLLLACIAKITSQDGEKGSTPAKKRIVKEKDEIAVTFCKEIPNLLVRFQSDAEKLSLLVQLIPSLSLGHDVSGLQTTHVKNLLKKLKHAYSTHSEVELLKVLSLSLHHLHQSHHEIIKRESDVVIHELIEDVADKVESLLRIDAEELEEESRNKRRISISKQKDLADNEFALGTALARLRHMSTHINIREFLPTTHPTCVVPSPANKKKKKSADLDKAEISAALTDRMDSITGSVVKLIQRRAKNILELNHAMLQPFVMTWSLEILYADLLWLTHRVFQKAEAFAPADDESSSVDASTLEQVEKVQRGRQCLEEALIAVLEMHFKKTQKQESQEEESQLAMEEIVFENEETAKFVKTVQRCGYFTFCDAQCLFVEKFKESPPPFDALEWNVPKVLMLLTQVYFENEMEDTVEAQPEDEENTQEENEKKNTKAEVLVALGRVSHCNPSNKRQAAAVLRYLVGVQHESQEVVKAFSKHVKSEAPIRFLEIQMTALRQVYSTILGMKEELEELGDDEAEKEELQESIESSESDLKDLAKRLSQTLGVGKIAVSLRAPFLRFLCEGVRYALEKPMQFSFLEGIKPYLSHLDKKTSMKQLHTYFKQMLERLAETGEGVPTEDDDVGPEWRLVFDFQSLISGSDSTTPKRSSTPLKKNKETSAGDENESQADRQSVTGDFEVVDEGDTEKLRVDGDRSSSPSRENAEHKPRKRQSTESIASVNTQVKKRCLRNVANLSDTDEDEEADKCSDTNEGETLSTRKRKNAGSSSITPTRKKAKQVDTKETLKKTITRSDNDKDEVKAKKPILSTSSRKRNLSDDEEEDEEIVDEGYEDSGGVNEVEELDSRRHRRRGRA